MENSAEPMQQKAEPQKKCGFRRYCAAFFRWVFIVLFAVILLGGLYFRAPWKILVLDALLLALLTVVPRKKRKYGWAMIGCAVLAVTVWIFLPEKDAGDWKPYTLEKEIEAFNATYTVPDEENAAIVYNRLFEEIKQNCQSGKISKNRFAPSSGLDENKIKDWLSTNKQMVFNALKVASQKSKCYWLMNSDGDSVNYTYMSALKYTMRFLIDEISYDIEHQNSQAAIEKLSWGFLCARHLNQQADVTYYLVGTAIEAMYHRAAWQAIVHLELSEHQLDELSTVSRLNSHNWGAFLERLAEYATLRNNVKFSSTIYEMNLQNKFRFSGNLMGIGVSLLDHWFMCPSLTYGIESPYWQERRVKTSRTINWWYVPSSPLDLTAMFDKHARLYAFMNTSIHAHDVLPEISWKSAELNCDYLVKLNTFFQVNALYKVHQINARILSAQIATQILLASREYYQQYKDWPISLEELKMKRPDLILIDPLNDGRFVYKRVDKDFIFYSKGLNGIDEGGHRNKQADDLLIWPEALEEIPETK